jgi:NADPH2:quinone reductase
VKRLGADHVINHTQPLQPQLSDLGHPAVDIVTAFVGTQAHAAEIAEIIAPEGHVGLIEGGAGITGGELGQFFQNCVTLHFELMFTRPRLDGGTMIRQHEILSAVAVLVDHGKIRTTLTKRLSPISAATLREAHAIVESGTAIGKVVVEGWPE